ncbi:MAG: HlyC/CorC family transporter [Rhodococcus sp.]|nr:HlyC/CorC family transporter [Rhodococcus sp. (in: high G+C Gram-positive bacteria)]
MTGDFAGNLALVLVFILMGGLFAGTEMALVTLRDSQVNRLESRGARGARAAALARDPNRFLSAVQVGVTVAGFFSAAYGASALAPNLVPVLESWGLSTGLADVLALVGITLVISYLSLIFGELVPKRIGLQRATSVASFAGPFIDRFATVMRPVIALLSASTNVIVRMLGGDPHQKSENITHAELRELVAGHAALGDDERRILADVFDTEQRSLAEVMSPRTEIEFVDASSLIDDARTQAVHGGHTRYPVSGDSLDDVIGIVHVRDLLLAGPTVQTAREVMTEILHLPGTKPALPALSVMRKENMRMAVVVDEYGGTAGIVTFEDIVEELIGEIGEVGDDYGVTPHVDGLLIIEDFAEKTGIVVPEGPYETIAGYMMFELRRMPRVGDDLVVGNHRLTVTRLDGRRIDRIGVEPIHPHGRPGYHH